MSLVNQMLRDLDERNASSLERAGVAAQVRALPREKRTPWANAWPVAVGGIIGLAGIWFAYDATRTPAATPPRPDVAAAMPMPTLVVSMPPASDEPADTPKEEAQSPAAESLKVDFKLSQPSRHAAAAPSSARASLPAATAAMPVTTPAATPTQIDKRVTTPVETADGEYRKALAAHRQGRSNEALEGLQSALRLDARHAPARQAMLSVLLEQRRWPEAQAVAAEGLALLPGQAGWAMILARLQVEQGQVAEAERTMAAHAQHAERSADYLAFHGLLLEKLQRPQEARALFVKARDLGSLPPDLAAAIEQRLR